MGAQDAAITDARIIVGNGAVIPSGSIVVRGGKIVSVNAGSASTQGLKVIDAKGMSAMPGFIDAHEHINTGPQEKEQMQSLLEAGYTVRQRRLFQWISDRMWRSWASHGTRCNSGGAYPGRH